jgi:hypothetical protein
MKLFNAQKDIFNEMCRIIRMGNTGPPAVFASKLNIEVSTFYVYLKEMRRELAKFKVAIYYDEIEQTYAFSKEGTACLGWTWTPA